jgi:two-component SAPR family response regulator
VVRSAADAIHANKAVSFKSDVKESLKSLDTKPIFVCKDSHHKYKSRKTNNDVLSRELGLKQITLTSMLAVEPGLRCTA